MASLNLYNKLEVEKVNGTVVEGSLGQLLERHYRIALGFFF